MTYKEATEKLQKAKSDALKAEKSLVLAQTALQKSRPKIEEAHEALTDVMARQEVGDATDAEVEKAKRAFEKSHEELQEAKTKLKAKEKALPLFRQKVVLARESLREPAKAHYQKEAEPITKRFLKAFDEFDKVNQEVEALSEEITRAGFSPDVYLPLPIQTVKTRHVKWDYTLEKYRHEIKQLTEN